MIPKHIRQGIVKGKTREKDGIGHNNNNYHAISIDINIVNNVAVGDRYRGRGVGYFTNGRHLATITPRFC